MSQLFETLDGAKELLPFMAKASVTSSKVVFFFFFNWSVIALQRCIGFHQSFDTAAAAAKLLQSCLTLCNPIDSSPPSSTVPGILQARTLSGLPFPSPMQESEK